MDQKKIRFLKGLSTAMVVAAMVFAFLIAGIRIFGVQVYGVLTGSMEPSYPTGSLIYVKAVETRELRVNDVITFSISPGVIATHRIVEIVPDEQYPTLLRYRTKGDANKDVDASLVSANNIIGKAMFAIPQLGYVANYIQQAPGIYVAILVCGLMIAFVFYTDSLDEKQKQQAQRTPAEGKTVLDVTAVINQLSQKLLGRDIIKKKSPSEPAVQQGYVPQQSAPQQMYYPQQYLGQNGGMPQGQYRQGYSQQSYPQQGYPQQGYQQYYAAAQYAQQGQYSPQYQQSYPQGQQTYYPQQMQQYQTPVPVQQSAPPAYYSQQEYGRQPYQQLQQNIRNPYSAQQDFNNPVQQNHRADLQK